MSHLNDTQQRARLTPAEIQRRRRARLPKRIDYYPSQEALAKIEAMQREQCQKVGGWGASATVSVVINKFILER